MQMLPSRPILVLCLLPLLFVAAHCQHQNYGARDNKKNQDSFLKAVDSVESILSELANKVKFPPMDTDYQNTAKLFDLIPGRYPDAISMPDVLQNLSKLPGGANVIRLLIDMIRNKTGISFPENIVDLVLQNSGYLLNYFKATPSFLHDLWSYLSLAGFPISNSTSPRVPSGFVFPNDVSTFDLDLDAYIPTIAPIANSSLWFGFYMPETTTREQAKINIVMSFIFNQLSDNHHLTPQHPSWFVLRYNNQPFTRVDDFLHALLKAPQSQVSTYLTKRIAAFFGLYVKNEQGKMLEVADPVMIQTQLFDSTGTKEAILPAIHSEYVIDIALGNFNFNIVWYEGDDGIGFFPGNMYLLESWVGRGDGPILQGEAGVDAIIYMSLLRDILIQLAIKNELWDNGYGISGVCDDSCGIIEILTAGESTEYPNLIQKSFVVPEIMERLRNRDEFSPMYYKLMQAVNSMPVDWKLEKDATAKKRALGTIVWPEGKEPFECVEEARQILSA